MSIENQLIIKHYIKLTEFLGRVLGPDYEVVLHNLVDKNGEIVAIANNHISGRQVGAPLTPGFLQILADKSYLNQDSRVHYRGYSNDGKQLRSSTMFLKNSENKLIGLLCINFTDERYLKLSEQLLSLCHPDAFVETSFQYNERSVKPIGKFLPSSTPVDTFHQSNNEVAKAEINQAMKELGYTNPRLNRTEKLEFLRVMDKNGALLLKGMVKEIAVFFKCSPATIYRQIASIRKEEQ